MRIYRDQIGDDIYEEFLLLEMSEERACFKKDVMMEGIENASEFLSETNKYR